MCDPSIAKPLGDAGSDLHGGAHVHFLERLYVGVEANVFDAFDTRRNHMLYGITAASTDPYDLDYRVFGV
jgi:hypothetical protein